MRDKDMRVIKKANVIKWKGNWGNSIIAFLISHFSEANKMLEKHKIFMLMKKKCLKEWTENQSKSETKQNVFYLKQNSFSTVLNQSKLE
jgi:hypothetical protein